MCECKPAVLVCLLFRWDGGDLPGGVCQQGLGHHAQLHWGLHWRHPGAAPRPGQGLLPHHRGQLPAQLLRHLPGDPVSHEEAHPRDPHHQAHWPGEGLGQAVRYCVYCAVRYLVLGGEWSLLVYLFLLIYLSKLASLEWRRELRQNLCMAPYDEEVKLFLEGRCLFNKETLTTLWKGEVNDFIVWYRFRIAFSACILEWGWETEVL